MAQIFKLFLHLLWDIYMRQDYSSYHLPQIRGMTRSSCVHSASENRKLHLNSRTAPNPTM